MTIIRLEIVKTLAGWSVRAHRADGSVAKLGVYQSFPRAASKLMVAANARGMTVSNDGRHAS